ncbi:hypothetical protein SK803_34215 [Lentzea sp. BCCO 10_0856]|uniref:Uncharacterized protein n=1 Tax=Lentzea miocenica TaxID=3095431 RepID=A0ABU4TBH1_9PSEU|nr:hypothetical protein [Lentzea sp. BCCO 10_0856]MDX8035292.1 hypothetical protein [Lentzea sp. BCCO 10_0856]
MASEPVVVSFPPNRSVRAEKLQPPADRYPFTIQGTLAAAVLRSVRAGPGRTPGQGPERGVCVGYNLGERPHCVRGAGFRMLGHLPKSWSGRATTRRQLVVANRPAISPVAPVVGRGGTASNPATDRGAAAVRAVHGPDRML